MYHFTIITKNLFAAINEQLINVFTERRNCCIIVAVYPLFTFENVRFGCRVRHRR